MSAVCDAENLKGQDRLGDLFAEALFVVSALSFWLGSKRGHCSYLDRSVRTSSCLVGSLPSQRLSSIAVVESMRTLPLPSQRYLNDVILNDSCPLVLCNISKILRSLGRRTVGVHTCLLAVLDSPVVLRCACNFCLVLHSPLSSSCEFLVAVLCTVHAFQRVLLPLGSISFPRVLQLHMFCGMSIS